MALRPADESKLTLQQLRDFILAVEHGSLDRKSVV